MKTQIGLTALLAALSTGAIAQNFNDPAEFERQKALLTVAPQGPDGKPWEQNLGGEKIDTAKYKKPGPYKLCFSNAGVNNPWRVVGFTNMQAEVDANKADIASFTHADAEGKDDKQISDINAFVNSGQCDALIVSPNTTAALTPAVEAAAKKLPVVVFDRGVDSKAPVTFINPIGGYGFGIQGASFIAEKIPAGGSVLALRILPGVDVLENRWAAAERIFKEKGIKVVGAEFTNGDNAKTKAIVEDYINRFGKIDGVWMDAGATAVAALEAFEDAGKPYPVINGEDQQDFLQKWKKNKLTAIAPTYPTYQWRTPVIAAIRILKGEPVTGPTWKLPQPAITADNLDKFVNDRMPPLHYALCGCEQMANYPARWGGK
ncbi:MAG: ABC transporter substrate-binding protein [Bosea sp.]|uniref:substrate-binding domain-containing protein n=1 Tax=Bosea sp. (in: a-proteobacteria) TaxID=1871050 RepID=UPI002399095D|nr:ABC transporter substrate-binding protein [Bosea sp. (in: a-proteobacteria)]MCP4739276.1 ABC transporter substrate-binding protein [Bosea sp. (in: a-proteobacteria)]